MPQRHVSLVGWALPHGPLLWFSVTMKSKSLQGAFSSDAMPRHVSLAGGHYPRPLLRFSATMKSKLQGLFRAMPCPETLSLAGSTLPQRPLLWFSATMKSSSRGFFELCQARNTSPCVVHSTPRPSRQELSKGDQAGGFVAPGSLDERRVRRGLTLSDRLFRA